jgi:hypothetical protein
VKDRLLDDLDRLVVAATEIERPPGNLPGAAIDDRVQVDPALFGRPDLRHVHVPEFGGTADSEVAGPTPAGLVP